MESDVNETSTQPGPRYQALLDLLRTADTIWNASRTFFAEWDLSPSQFNLLNLLFLSPEGRTQIQLSRALLMHRSNVTGLIDRLEHRGLVSRRDHPRDRRIHVIGLTPAGRRLLNAILPRYYTAAEAVWGDLPVDQLPPVMDALARLRDNTSRLEAEVRSATK
jgi:DNA-binding MarR family transcriptional regulator